MIDPTHTPSTSTLHWVGGVGGNQPTRHHSLLYCKNIGTLPSSIDSRPRGVGCGEEGEEEVEGLRSLPKNLRRESSVPDFSPHGSLHSENSFLRSGIEMFAKPNRHGCTLAEPKMLPPPPENLSPSIVAPCAVLVVIADIEENRFPVSECNENFLRKISDKKCISVAASTDLGTS